MIIYSTNKCKTNFAVRKKNTLNWYMGASVIDEYVHNEVKKKLVSEMYFRF